MTAAEPRWRGGVVFTPGLMAFTGDIGDTAAHSHAAVQVLLVTAGEVHLTDADGHTATAGLAIIPPGVRHEVHAVSATTGFVAFLDPAGITGRAALTRLRGLPPDAVTSWITAATPHTTATAPLPTSGPQPPIRSTHPVVAEALHRAADATGGPPSLGELAALVAISPSRLSHLFTEHVGLPYAAWRRWTRLQLAVGTIRAGGTLTEAAHAAGFADSAHLTNTCRDLLGITPTQVVTATGWGSGSNRRKSSGKGVAAVGG
ncbi:helix-turn-helix transcriptional regulator [Nocardia cyriacigeorgica]|uniref:helix-turn-helix transcriptional regulator n=1 Tax=Nocardia cyriacigeorgica TaxID=135487 RepID=UPI001894A5EB|nr:AraC family transcriptional regulator [Nocardia cyriacigeorgica]MBF6439587.1 helix-turn-helix domain-containing protein [Nocardia cyriacigeorgica]